MQNDSYVVNCRPSTTPVGGPLVPLKSCFIFVFVNFFFVSGSFYFLFALFYIRFFEMYFFCFHTFATDQPST